MWEVDSTECRHVHMWALLLPRNINLFEKNRCITQHDRPCYKRNTEACSRNHCCKGKAINIKYSQNPYSWLSYTARKSLVSKTCLSSVDWLTLQYFSTLSKQRHDFREKVNEHKMCFVSTNTSEIFLILRKIQRNITTNVYRCKCKVTVFLVRF